MGSFQEKKTIRKPNSNMILKNAGGNTSNKEEGWRFSCKLNYFDGSGFISLQVCVQKSENWSGRWEGKV